MVNSKCCDKDNGLGLPHRKSIARTALNSVNEVRVTDTQKPRSWDNSKQSQVIAMLRHPEGATIDQPCGIPGWQSHTMRGALAGAFKKKPGFAIASEKTEGGERVYHFE